MILLLRTRKTPEATAITLFRLVDTPQFSCRRALLALNTILTLDIKHTYRLDDLLLVIFSVYAKESNNPDISN